MANPFGYASSDSSETSEDERALPTLSTQAAAPSHPPASPQASSSVDSQDDDALADLLAMSAGSSSDEEVQATAAAQTTVQSQAPAAGSSAFSVPLLPSRPPPDAVYSAGRKRARPVSLEQQEQHIQKATEQAPQGPATAAGGSSGGVDYSDRAQLAAVETEVYKLRAAELKAQVLAKSVKPASKPGRHAGQPDEDIEPDTAFSLLTTAEYVPPAVDSSTASRHIATKTKELQVAKSMIIQAAAAGTTEQAHGGDSSSSDGELALELLDWQQ